MMYLWVMMYLWSKACEIVGGTDGAVTRPHNTLN